MQLGRTEYRQCQLPVEIHLDATNLVNVRPRLLSLLSQDESQGLTCYQKYNNPIEGGPFGRL